MSLVETPSQHTDTTCEGLKSQHFFFFSSAIFSLWDNEGRNCGGDRESSNSFLERHSVALTRWHSVSRPSELKGRERTLPCWQDIARLIVDLKATRRHGARTAWDFILPRPRHRRSCFISQSLVKNSPVTDTLNVCTGPPPSPASRRDVSFSITKREIGKPLGCKDWCGARNDAFCAVRNVCHI